MLSVSEFARLGGKARAQKLSKQRRLEISRAANEAKRLKRAEFTKFFRRGRFLPPRRRRHILAFNASNISAEEVRQECRTT